MKNIILGLCFFGLGANASAQVEKEIKTGKEVVETFFTNFGNGNIEGVIDVFSNTAKIVSINKQGIEGAKLYGTFEGRRGVRTFLNILSKTFETKAFSVDCIVSEKSVVFAKGNFIHKLKSTGNLFESDWALMCIVRDSKIQEYHFFEDSASFILANKR